MVGDAEDESKRDIVDKAASVKSIKLSATPDDDSQSGRSLRKAAIKCRERIGDLIKDQALARFISVPRECPGLYNPEEERKQKRVSERTHFYLVHDIFVTECSRIVWSSSLVVLVGKMEEESSKPAKTGHEYIYI